MTLEELISQNKRAWARIRELEIEIEETVSYTHLTLPTSDLV